MDSLEGNENHQFLTRDNNQWLQTVTGKYLLTMDITVYYADGSSVESIIQVCQGPTFPMLGRGCDASLKH